jgi:hypothetical protein
VLRCGIPLKAGKSAFQQPKGVLIGIEDSLGINGLNAIFPA